MANKIVTTAMLNEAQLAHHGIKGQKWGVRRTPEELGHRKLTARETKEIEIKGVKWRNVLSNLSCGTTALSCALLYTPLPPIIGVGFFAVSLGIFATLRIAEGIDNSIVNKMKKDPKRQLKSLKDAERIKPPENSLISVLRVNNLKSQNPQYHNNCPNATMAYELRRRGYNVNAKPSPKGLTADKILKGYNIKEPSLKVDKLMDGNRKDQEAGFAKVKTYFDKQPKNFRGAVMVMWGKTGAGHIFNVEKINGKTICYDAQTGKSGAFKTTFDNSLSKAQSSPENYIFSADSISVIRTDNAKINDAELSDMVMKEE